MRNVHRSLSFKESDENIDQPWRLKKEPLKRKNSSAQRVRLFSSTFAHFEISFLNIDDEGIPEREKHLPSFEMVDIKCIDFCPNLDPPCQHFSRERRDWKRKIGTWKGGKTEDNGGEEIGWHKARSNSCYSRLGEHDQNVARIYELDNQQHPH